LAEQTPHHDTAGQSDISIARLSDPTSDLEVFAKEVLTSLITDNLPPTPNNFALYFDRILDDKSTSLKKQIKTVLDLEEDSNDDKSVELEKILKEGFSSVKSILQVSASLYKNMALMSKILDTRKEELKDKPDAKKTLDVVLTLEKDLTKLDTVLKKQITHMKEMYDDTAGIIKQVENETIFDNQYGLYNKRYLLTKLAHEGSLISEFKHKSSLITLTLSRHLDESAQSEKARQLMTRTISRLLLKTSRRSDVIAHYGQGIFAMLLKHTDLQSSKMAASRLFELVESSNFFLAEKEVELKIAIGIAEVFPDVSAEETLVTALDAMQKADDTKAQYVVGEANRAAQ